MQVGPRTSFIDICYFGRCVTDFIGTFNRTWGWIPATSCFTARYTLNLNNITERVREKKKKQNKRQEVRHHSSFNRAIRHKVQSRFLSAYINFGHGHWGGRRWCWFIRYIFLCLNIDQFLAFHNFIGFHRCNEKLFSGRKPLLCFCFSPLKIFLLNYIGYVRPSVRLPNQLLNIRVENTQFQLLTNYLQSIVVMIMVIFYKV